MINLSNFIKQIIHLWRNFENARLETRSRNHKNKPTTNANDASHAKKYLKFSWIVFLVSKTSDSNKSDREEKNKRCL
jgi:hypothetical protein